MNPNDYQRLRDLFLKLCDASEQQQEAVLDELSEEDLPLREELRSLLREDRDPLDVGGMFKRYRSTVESGWTDSRGRSFGVHGFQRCANVNDG